MRRLRAAALSAAVALVGAVVGAAGAAAAAPRTARPTTTLTVELSPTSETSLHALAAAHGLTRAERARRVAALVPDSRRHRDVTAAARSLGLTVTRTTAWSMRVEGPAQTVAALFGTLPAAPSGVAGRAYPLVPAALARYVVAALPTTGRVAKPLASLSPRDGIDFRTAYSAPPGSTGAGLAVATVQLSGWHQPSGDTPGLSCPATPSTTRWCDLQHYADLNNIPFDVKKQYRAISIAGAPTTKPDGDGGDEEVALDQESLLATAPGATQVAYFAPNDDGGDGYVQAIHQVGQDAIDKTFPTAALSLSWGGCEASDDRKWLASMDQALEFTLASGVTVFAASGDQGSLDCFGEVFGPAANEPAVDYPASSPYVVAVGGTSLPPSGSTATAVGWDGSGGGESALEPLASWQLSVASKSRSNHRLVPDIASDADPNNGLCVYESSTTESQDCGTSAGRYGFTLGGTSLASPTQAALLVDTLAAGGWQGGIGDIHPALYAGAPDGAITDITSDADPSGNGTYHSGKGYDLVTGLGTPVWTSLQSWLGQFDMGAPRATRSLTFSISPHAPTGYAPGYATWSSPVDGSSQAQCSAGDSSSAPTSVTIPAGTPDGSYRFSVAGLANAGVAGAAPTCHTGFASVVLDRKAPSVTASLRVSGAGLATASWSFADAAPSSGLRKFVVVATAGTKTAWTFTTTSRSRVFTALPNSRWHITVTAYDNAGNTAIAKAHLLDDTSAFSLGAHWSRISSRAAYRRSFARTNAVGTTARVTATAKTFVVFVTECSSCGEIGVYDTRGHRLKTVDTFSSSTRYRVPVTIRALSAPAKQTLVLRVLSSKNRHSHGHYVGLDALALA